MDDFDRLLQENTPVEPSPAFENRLFAALETKQRELGRIPAAVPVRPVPPPDRRGVRISLVALSSLAAGLTIGLSLSGQVAPERAAPSIQRDLVGVPTPPAGVEVRLPDVTLPKPAPVTSAAPAEVVAIASATPPAPPVQVVAATTPTRLPLEDGSVVFLDAGARARIGARTVTLESGRGFVEVAKGEKPFTVLSGGARAIAHGTKFAFEQGARGLSVAVSQGTVELANALGDALVHVGELGRAEGSSAPTATAAPRVSSLCEWMRDLYAPRKADKTAAGDLVAFDPDGQEIHLSTRNVLVTVHIEDGIARTTVDTTYYNETWNRLEGTFTFVAPEGASVSRLAMYVNGELQEGGVLERTEARQVYEQIRYERRRDPALLEWMEGNVYRMRIFPLEPRQEKRVIVSYTQELEPLYGKLRYALPLEVRGREVYDHLGIKVRIKRARRVPVSSFPLDVAHEGEDLLLSREEIQVQPKKDLILYLDELVPTATTLEAEDGRYVLARWRPEVAAAKRSNDPRHFAIVVEESGARTQADIIAQNELVSRFLSELDDQDQFQLFALSSRIQRFRGDWAPARENAGEALAFLDSLRPLGAEDLGLGLGEAARALEGKTNPQVLYVGSGILCLGERDPARLVEKLAPGTVFVGAGVGKQTDASLLASLASRTAGTYTLLNPEEPITWRVFDLVTALATARLSGLHAVALDARNAVVPGEVLLSRGTVADGEEVRVLGRFAADARPDRLAISYFQGSELHSTTLSLAGAREDALYLPRLWARRHVESLIQDGAERHRSEILGLGKRFFLATPFTSLIVLENEAMFRQFGVEHAPRDPFAFYELPQRIPVVSDARLALPETEEQSVLATIARPPVPDTPPRGYAITATPGYLLPGKGVNANGQAFTGFQAVTTPVPVGTFPFMFGDGIRAFAGAFGQTDRTTTVEAPPAPRRIDLGLSYRNVTSPVLSDPFNVDKVGDEESAKKTEKSLMSQSRRTFTGFTAPMPRRVVTYPSETYWREKVLQQPALNDPVEQDLLLLAPGLALQDADVPSLLERELGTKPTPGKQDPRALERLARARQAFGVRAVSFDGYIGFVAGDGRLSLEHTLDSRLEEILLVTDEARFDLYPDLGLAARRLRAHLQDERLADLVPFAPPTVRALEGWDVAPRGEDGVVLIRGDARVELVFDARGVVLSRREILDGTLTRELRFDGTKTQVSDTTAAASFVPRLEGYVVLDLPTRTAAFLSEKLQAAPASEKRFLQDQLYFSRLVTHEAPGPVPDERRGIFVLKLAAGWLTLDDAIAATKNHPVLGLYARAVLETSPQERLEAAGGVARTPGFFGTMGRYVAAVTAIQEAVSKTPSDRHFAAERALTFARENPCALLVLALARHGAALPFYSTEDKLTLLRLYEAVPATSPLAAEAHFELAALFRQLIRYPDASRQEEVAYELAMKNGFFPLPPEGISSLDEQLLEKAVRWAANKPFLLVAIACSAPRSPQAEKAVALLQEPIGPRLREAIETALVPRLATETMTRTLISHPSLAGIGALHDAAGGFALEQGRTAVALQDFEHALGCESRAVDLSFRRARVQMMFSLYSQIANASLGPSDPSLVARILDTLERARRVDPVFDGYYAPCARALVACHEKALALDSATTPIALAPGDGARWTLAASVYAGIGEHGLAASFHHEAALLEPQDPTPLLEEARERSLNGEETRARALYREILGKTWHERFANILATARASAN